MKSYIFPTKIALQGQANCENLLKKQPLQIGLAERTISVFEKGSFVVLDFAKEICGGVRILTYHSRATIRIRFGESLSECFAELGGEKNATNDHSLRDFKVQLQNYSDMVFGQTGFRFVRIDFEGDAKIKSIVAESYIYNKPVLYAYNGKDEAIQKIYETAKRTVDLCTAKGYVWDGIKRDRLVWIGDMHPEMLALTSLYGRVGAIEKSLDFVKEQTPMPDWMNGIAMYSMWWIIIIADYYERTKTQSFTQKQLPYLQDLLCLMDENVKDDGSMLYGFNFVDWPTSDKPDLVHGVRAIHILAVKKAISLLTAFGKETTIAERLLEKLLKVQMSPLQSKQIIALKYFATQSLSDEEKQALLNGGAQGMSTFMSYYILKAVASFDRQKAIAMMKEYYCAMLDKGATTFWEDFDIAWAENSCNIDQLPVENQKDIHGDYGAYCYKGFRHSLCHGWSAGVITFIQEEC